MRQSSAIWLGAKCCDKNSWWERESDTVNLASRDTTKNTYAIEMNDNRSIALDCRLLSPEVHHFAHHSNWSMKKVFEVVCVDSGGIRVRLHLET